MAKDACLFKVGRWTVYVDAKTREIAAWAEFYTINNELRHLNFYSDGSRDLCLYDTSSGNNLPIDIKEMHISRRKDLFEISKKLGLELPVWEIRDKANKYMRRYYDGLVEGYSSMARSS